MSATTSSYCGRWWCCRGSARLCVITRVAPCAAATSASSGSCSPVVSLITAAPAAMLAGSDLRSERVDGDDDVAGCGDPLDNRHHTVELFCDTNLRSVRRKWHAADIDPTRTSRGGSQRRCHRVIKHVRTTMIEEGIGSTIHDAHHDDFMIEVERSPDRWSEPDSAAVADSSRGKSQAAIIRLRTTGLTWDAAARVDESAVREFVVDCVAVTPH